jgi:hypothetical protein
LANSEGKYWIRNCERATLRCMDGKGDDHQSQDCVPRVAKDVRSVSDADGGVILDIKRGQIYRLNAAGAMILEGVKNGRRQSQIAEALTNRFRIDRELAETDVRSFMARLQASGLLES